MAIVLTTANNIGWPMRILPAGTAVNEVSQALAEYGAEALARALSMQIHHVVVRAWRDTYVWPGDLLEELSLNG